MTGEKSNTFLWRNMDEIELAVKVHIVYQDKGENSEA